MLNVSEMNFILNNVLFKNVFVFAILGLAHSKASPTNTAPTLSTSVYYDVVVYGATPAGIAAAVTAANISTRPQVRVALIEPTPYLGGMAGPGGIGLRDIDFEAASGVNDSRSVLNRFLHYNRLAYGAASPVWQPDERIALASWETIVHDPRYNISLFRNMAIDESPTAIVMAATKILSIRCVLTNGTVYNITFSAGVFIDASYEADIVIRSGAVSFTYGREPASIYKESLAGVQPFTNFTQFQYPVDATWNNSLESGLLPGVDAAVPPIGSADERLMPYSYRFCIIKSADRVPFYRPSNYNAFTYELLVRYALSLSAKYPNGTPFSALVDPLEYKGYPSNATVPMKYDLCESGDSAVSTDEPTALYGTYVLGNRAVRANISAHVRDWVLGWLYTLATDSRLSNTTRTTTNEWGLCPTAWPENQHVPLIMYVREGARIVGDDVSTQNNLRKGVCRNTSIGVGSWTVDTHIMRRYARAVPLSNGTTRYLATNEGEIGFAPLPGNGSTYDLPYSILLPKRSEVTNLLVPTCPSTSHVAFSAVRVEPTFMQLGGAAGIAAAITIQQKLSAVHDVPIHTLQTSLIEAGQCVHWPNCETAECPASV